MRVYAVVEGQTEETFVNECPCDYNESQGWKNLSRRRKLLSIVAA
jgi:hypothetical protein